MSTGNKTKLKSIILIHEHKYQKQMAINGPGKYFAIFCVMSSQQQKKEMDFSTQKKFKKENGLSFKSFVHANKNSCQI